MERSGDLEAIEPFLNEVLATVAPAKRRRLMDKLMRAVRRAQATRIGANVEPEGGKMAPRKPREGKRGKMFRRIGKQSSLKIRLTPDEGELQFANRLVEQTAAEHHFGLTGFVGKTRKGRTIRTRYAARRLLGFGKESDELLDEVVKHISLPQTGG